MAYSVPIGYFDEGQQADEYRLRKAKEAEAEKKADDERYGPHGTRNPAALRYISPYSSTPITKRHVNQNIAGDKANAAKGSNSSGSSYTSGQNRHQFEKDYDAGRKHYRRTHKNTAEERKSAIESASIFDEIRIM